MMALSIIGFFAIVFCAAYVTAAAVSIVFGELAFSGGISPMSVVFVALAGLLWTVAFWLSPFTVSMQVAA
jgi:hypothetical protein